MGRLSVEDEADYLSARADWAQLHPDHIPSIEAGASHGALGQSIDGLIASLRERGLGFDEVLTI